MRIIPKEKQSSGAFFQIQNDWNEQLPSTHYEVANGVELSCGGFGTLVYSNGIVTGFIPDETAWNAWKLANPEPMPQPTTEEKLAETIRAQNATITLMASVIADLQSDVEALQV